MATRSAGLDTNALAAFLVEEAHAHSVDIRKLKRLTGGMIQENWLLEATFRGGPFAGRGEQVQQFVLRADAPSQLSASLSRVEEYRVIEAVHALGVRVPAPIALCADERILGRQFTVVRFVQGSTDGERLVKDGLFVGDRDALARALAEELALIHSVVPGAEARDAGLDCLTPPAGSPTRAGLALLEEYLDELPGAHPVLEWALRWLQRNAPRLEDEDTTLVHGDFRTGNYLVDAEGLSAVLDWEFAHFGNPMEDLGSLRAQCWRFGREDRAMGGMAAWSSFADAYALRTGKRASMEALRYFEVLEHVRFAVICANQAQRHLSGEEGALEIALAGRRLPELEQTILLQTREPVDPDAFIWEREDDA